MRTAIKNVRIFNGECIDERDTLIIEDGKIASGEGYDQCIDGQGGTLLPGLIDSHVHLYENRRFQEMAIACGITTMLDMGVRDTSIVDAWRSQPDLPDLLSSCGVIYAPGSKFALHMQFPEDMVCGGIDDVERIVDDRIRAGADYIKLIFENSTRKDTGINTDCLFPLEVGRAIVDYSHSKGKKVAAHAPNISAYELGLDLGIDVLMHMPYTEPLSPELAKRIADSGTIVVPTLAMGSGLLEFIGRQILAKIPAGAPIPPMPSFNLAIRNLSIMLEAGVRIIAGTDSNLDDPTTPSDVFYGTALQDELVWYVQSGMTPAEALHSATADAAEYWGITDRGILKEGCRADLLLVDGRPDENISDIKKVRAVFKNGERIR